MTRTRPCIGVTGPDRGGVAAWLFTALAILLQGGWPTRITPSRGVIIDKLDGLVIGGGADIAPDFDFSELELDQEAIRSRNILVSLLMLIVYPVIFVFRRLVSLKDGHDIDAARDELENGLLKQVLERQLPVLGICRGSQLINRFYGGDLHSDIAEFYEEEAIPRSVFPTKDILLEPGSQLARALEIQKCRINALHHQAIDRLGEGLRITAREPNGIVQAIEHEQLAFVIGVQWHPEYMVLHKVQRRLFRMLITTAIDNQTSRLQSS